MRRALAVALCASPILAACAKRFDPTPPPGQPQRVAAALATLTVTNHTKYALSISFRPANGRGTVTVGKVAAMATAQLAPIPASEPILLSARTPADTELSLPARSFLIGERWTWVIPADAEFRDVSARPGG